MALEGVTLEGLGCSSGFCVMSECELKGGFTVLSFKVF